MPTAKVCMGGCRPPTFVSEVCMGARGGQNPLGSKQQGKEGQDLVPESVYYVFSPTSPSISGEVYF